MVITYAAPNRSHHYRYASILARTGLLHRFVCGFPRFSRHPTPPELAGKIIRADHLQYPFLAGLRLGLPPTVNDELAYLSKCWIDRRAEAPARASDLFLFYNGAGLGTAQRLRDTAVIRVVEAVNSHVRGQEQLMREEYEQLGVAFRPFHEKDVARRLAELDLADAILCPSRFVKDSFVREGFPKERVHIVPYGIPEAGRFVPDRAPDETFRVLYVGQLSPRKGLRYLIEAFDQLRHPLKELVFVGPRANPSGLENIALPAGVILRGVLKGDDLARAYRSASVFVLPTVEEGLALVLGEALAHGVPVVTTVNSGGDDLFHDGVEGFLVPIRSPESLAEKMQLLADDPALRARLGAAARLRAREGGWDRTEILLGETLRAMLKQGRR